MKSLILSLGVSVACMAGVHGQSLQKVCNTNPTGTSSVVEIGPVFNNKLYFTGSDGVHGNELWVHDAATFTSQMYKDINPAGSAYPYWMGAYKNMMYFFAQGSANDNQLWMTDGNPANTYQVSNITGSGMFNDFRSMTLWNNRLYFTCCDPNYGDIWETDGTQAGTKKLKDFTGKIANSKGLTVFKDQLLFFTTSGSSSYDFEPWISDHFPSGTHMLADVNPNSGYGCGGESFTLMNSKAFFSGASAMPVNGCYKYNLWATDGWAVWEVKDIQADSNYSFRFYNAGDKIFFVTKHKKQVLPDQLWVTDGTTQGTQKLLDMPNFQDGYVFYNKLYFGYDYRKEFWVSDGTVAGTNKLKDIAPVPYGTTVKLNGRMYFFAHSNEPGGMVNNIWSTNGTAAGTVNMTGAQVNDPAQLENSSQLVEYDGWIYFRGNIDKKGYELWRLHPFPTSVEEQQAHATIDVFPNPSNGNITIRDSKNALTEAQVFVQNMQGQQVYTTQTVPSNGQLQLSLPSGVYFLKYVSGDVTAVKQISIVR